jgi:hypothetical protein
MAPDLSSLLLGNSMNIEVEFRGSRLNCSVGTSATLGDLKLLLVDMTSVPVEKQKLLGKTLKLSVPNDTKLANIKQPWRFTLVGTTSDQIDNVQHQIERQAKRSVASARAMNRPKADPQYTFHSLEVLPGLKEQDRAISILERLKSDPGIINVMKTNKWNIGILCEMSPITQPTILGYNMNKGQKISLRLRTDDMQGFRYYSDIRRVLIHELTHMVHGDHSNEFWHLCRQLEIQVNSTQGHSLHGGPEYRGPIDQGESEWDRIERGRYQGGTFVLGGSSELTKERPMREVLAEAAQMRLTEVEKQLEHGCGSSRD